MFKPSDYETAQSFDGTTSRRLPAGGYVCKIIKAQTEKSKAGKDMLVIYFDIVEGEFAGFFKAQYESAKKVRDNPSWNGVYRTLYTNANGQTNPYYKGLLTCIENSNNYRVNWSADEKQFNGKLIGILFRDEEYIGSDQNKHISSKALTARTVNSIRDGDYEVPPMKTLDESDIKVSIPSQGYTQIQDDDLPF